MGSKTRLSSYCIKRANNGVNLVTSHKIIARMRALFTESIVWRRRTTHAGARCRCADLPRRWHTAPPLSSRSPRSHQGHYSTSNTFYMQVMKSTHVQNKCKNISFHKFNRLIHKMALKHISYAFFYKSCGIFSRSQNAL